MTQAEFTAFYPQFAGFTPAVVMTTYIGQANARFESFGEDQEEARRLYIAHKLTMYAYTFPAATGSGDDPSPITAASLSAAGKASSAQQATSKKVGEVQVSYSSGYSSSSSGSGQNSRVSTSFSPYAYSCSRIYSCICAGALITMI